MRKGTMLLGLLLVLIGLYSLLRAFKPDIIELERLWPVVMIAGGVTLLIGHFRHPRGDSARVFWSVALILSGLLFLLISMTSQNYAILQIWWPAFIVIAGISFLALWLAEGLRNPEALFLAIVSLVFGGASIAINLRLFGPNTAREVNRLWPVILVLLGLILILRGILTGKRAK